MIKKRLLVTVALVILVAGLGAGIVVVPTIGHGSANVAAKDVPARRATAFLVGGPSYGTLQGKASLDTRSGAQLFDLSVKAIAAASTTVEAFILGTRVGSLSLDDGGAGRLQLRAVAGSSFPRISGAALIELRTSEGTLVASGLLD